jgi:hypothetical protein
MKRSHLRAIVDVVERMDPESQSALQREMARLSHLTLSEVFSADVGSETLPSGILARSLIGIAFRGRIGTKADQGIQDRVFRLMVDLFEASGG